MVARNGVTRLAGMNTSVPIPASTLNVKALCRLALATPYWAEIPEASKESQTVLAGLLPLVYPSVRPSLSIRPSHTLGALSTSRL